MEQQEHFDKRFPNENACREFLKRKRWPNGVRCPRCGNEKVYELKARPFNWLCKSGKESLNTETGEVVTCSKNGYRFSVITGTVFENTKRPLRTWFKISYMILVSKKGVSALQLHRMMYGYKHTNNYHTTWYQCHRIRAAMKDSEWEQLMGEVEVDETYIGGKDANRHWDKKKHMKGGWDKTPVIGAISRKGSVVAKVIDRADMPTMHRFVNDVVDKEKVSLIATDEHSGYQYLERWQGLPHQTVNHRKGEYVRGVVHTNNMESFWSLLKRGIMGSFHHVSADYLPLYVAEFAFRHNRRNEADAFDQLISNA
jgi:hypothetical protein